MQHLIIRFFFLLIILCLFIQPSTAQDSLLVSNRVDSASSKIVDSKYKLGYKQLIIPGACLLYGLASLKIDALKDLNTSTDNEIQEHKPGHIIWDNFSQYTPAFMVYGLNFAGVKGWHNFRDRSIIYLTSQLLMTSIVYPVKILSKEQRPDGSDMHSFPSGHTATAFSSAQFLFREYYDSNLLLSLSGYPIAIFTGVYRIVNNKHWVGDVVAGAGIGIFSTEFAYWLYPKINRLLGGKGGSKQVAFAPYYQPGSFGLSLAKNF